MGAEGALFRFEMKSRKREAGKRGKERRGEGRGGREGKGRKRRGKGRAARSQRGGGKTGELIADAKFCEGILMI